MEVRIKPQINQLNNKTAWAVINKGGVMRRFTTKQQARDWAIQQGYTLRYSGQ